jgi:D-alanyl-D-alanine carboxypeptidase (penicillin-binding protein 5/6)
MPRKLREFLWTSLSALLLCLALPIPGVQATPVLIPAPPQVAARSWVLMDANTGEFLVEHNANEPLPPASLTKMMTSYVVASELHDGKFNGSSGVPISVKAWQMGGSKMFVREGTEVSVDDLLLGVVIQSGNDATVALAEYVAGSEDAFADVMNQQAALLGMTNTHFLNSTGWPAEGHLTTAHDLALLARALIRDYPEHYALYSQKYFEYNDIRQANRNRLLWLDSSVDGVKTGHTEAAGYCLVASAEREGTRFISVVMGTDSDASRAQESQKLLSYGFRYFETANIHSTGDVLQEDVRVWFGKKNTVALVVPEDIQLTIPRGAMDLLERDVRIDEVVEAPLDETTEIGRLAIAYQGQQLYQGPLVASEPVAEAGFFSRLWDHLVLLIKSLFV